MKIYSPPQVHTIVMAPFLNIPEGTVFTFQYENQGVSGPYLKVCGNGVVNLKDNVHFTWSSSNVVNYKPYPNAQVVLEP